MYAAFGAVSLVILAGAFALGLYVAKGGRGKTGFYCLALGIIIAVTFFVAQIVQIHYRPPLGWLAALAVGVAAIVTFFIRIGRDVSWRRGRVVALGGMMFVVFVASVFTAMSMPSGGIFIPLFEDRARQMAEAQGFTVLLAPDETMFTEYLPVTEVGSDDGVQIQYEGFTLVERAADDALGEAELRAVLAPGTELLGPGSVRVEQDARYETAAVNDAPALIAEYEDRSTAEKVSLGIENVRVLAFARDGALVIVYSHGWMQYEPADESYSPVDALSADELVRIAESLEPAQ